MDVGIPKEIKNNENRVSVTPDGVAKLTAYGHRVFVQKEAGVGSGFSDQVYQEHGAIPLDTLEAVYAQAEMIIKVKEPLESEYNLIRKEQIIYTYFHFASYKPLMDAMLKSKAICIAYETIEDDDGQLPLLVPMSEVAGRMSVQEGTKYLQKHTGGKGILLGGVPGVAPAKVIIIGGGVVGTEAAKMAAGLGARVFILDLNLKRLRYLSEILPANVETLYASTANINHLIKIADLVIGAVLIAGAKAPKIITRSMLSKMGPGTVLVDVSVDQGGCIETSKPTTHQNPTFIIDGVIHYCVANMPGAVPYTSTLALTNATLDHALALADKGWQKACQDDKNLAKGLNVVRGQCVYKPLSEAFNVPYISIERLLLNQTNQNEVR